MAVRFTLQHVSPFHAPRRCHLLLLSWPPFPRYYSDFSHLREEMISRLLPYASDHITPTQTRSLRLALAGCLPSFSKPHSHFRKVNDRSGGSANLRLEMSARDRPSLGPTHHLVYFPNVPPAYLLLPDGTDSLHSPGPPFTRRMWAGGSMVFLQDIEVTGHPYHCSESIADVQVKGREGEEKVFVRIQRIVFPGRYPGEVHKGRLRLVEQRTLVFMRDNRQEGSPTVSHLSSKILKPIQKPDFSHKMIPTRELLFRFSALTFNAHAIHLDKHFCREVEGHRDLLVHGPLTVVLMIEVLRNHLQTLANSGRFSRLPERITQVQYRNLAPLYAGEEMTICVKRREKETGRRTSTWDVWIEGLDGGYAVKGTVETVEAVTRFSGLDKRFTSLRLSEDVSGYGITPQQEENLEGETKPEEQIALQNSINTRNEPVSNEESILKEDLVLEERTEKEKEDEAEDETEDETAPYFQR